jgi:hypothetical protein
MIKHSHHIARLAPQSIIAPDCSVAEIDALQAWCCDKFACDLLQGLWRPRSSDPGESASHHGKRRQV